MDTVKIKSGKTKMIAHRGLSGIETENTCASFVAAGNRSYFGIEADLHVTADGRFVIIHDENTFRVSLGRSSVNVEKSDYSEFENILLPDVTGSFTRRDLKIPLLKEYVEICKKYGKTSVLELKNSVSDGLLRKIYREIEEINYIKNIIFISFDLDNCISIKKIAPENEVQWLIGNKEITTKMIQTLSENSLGISIYYKKLDIKNISLLHRNGIKVNCWTCDDQEEAEKLANYGVDYITTNILE